MFPVQQHIPVLLNDMLQALAPERGKVYVDATFGGGGYTRAILATGARVIAFDRDPFVLNHAPIQDNFQLIQAPFSQMAQYVQEKIDGVVFDFGVSSFQLDTPNRGFSFQHNGPLDMRMGLSDVTAAHIVNTYSEKDIADIIYTYGEEHKSRLIARLIVQNRPFYTTKQLADMIAHHIKGKPHLHAATLTFQALRIYVNDELHEIRDGLHAAMTLLKPHGRIVTVTFHALEDRIVKQFFKDGPMQSVYKHVITPSHEEVLHNPRSRSAKLRCGIMSENV